MCELHWVRKEKLYNNKRYNFCVTLIGFEWKKFFDDFKIRDITYNKTFWKAVKPSFTNTITKNPYNAIIETEVVS